MVIEHVSETLSSRYIYFNHPWYLIKSGYLILTWIILSFHLELIGPTLPILGSNLQVIYGGMSTVLASRNVGYLVSNLLGVILQNIVQNHSEGLLFLSFILPAIVVFATPFVTSFILMCVLSFIQGIAKSFTDISGNHLLLAMWGVHAAAPLNIVHLGFGIGAIFSNLLVRPFITENTLLSNAINNERISSNIFIPYSITASLCFLIAVGHLFFYVTELKKRREKLFVRQADYASLETCSDNVNSSIDNENSSPYSPRTWGRGFIGYGLSLAIIFILYTFIMGGIYEAFSKFFFSYLKFEKFHLSNQTASWGIILYWFFYSIGRLIFSIVPVFVSTITCLNIIWFGALCLASAWLIFVWIIGLTSTSLFILGAITGLIYSPVFPLSMAYFNQRLNVVPLLLVLLLCGSALGQITFSKIAGLIMDYNPNHFPTFLAFCIPMSIILYVISHVIHFFHQRKNLSNTRTSVINSSALSSERSNEEELQMANYPSDQQEK